MVFELTKLFRFTRCHPLMHVRVVTGSAISKSCAARNDVDMSILRQLLRPRRFQLRKIACRLAALRAAAEAEPRRLQREIGPAARVPMAPAYAHTRRDAECDQRELHGPQ